MPDDNVHSLDQYRKERGEIDAQFAASIAKAERERLQRAHQISTEMLEGNPKLNERDRSLFAHNLGTIVKKLESIAQISLRDIFLKAFHVDGGISRYKKRKRYMSFPDEELVTNPQEIRKGKYSARAMDYVYLLEAIYELTYIDSVDKDKYYSLLLKLIEGTNFDDQRSRLERGNEQATNELQNRLDAMAEKISSNTDLDSIVDILETHGFSLNYDANYNFDIKLGNNSWIGLSNLKISNTICEFVHYHDPISPQIVLGRIYSRFPVVHFLSAEKPKESDIEWSDLANYIYSDIISELVINTWGTTDVFEIISERFTSDEFIVRDDDRYEEYLEYGGIWVCRTILLQLRRDTLTGRWRICLTLSSRFPDDKLQNQVPPYCYYRRGKEFLQTCAYYDDYRYDQTVYEYCIANISEDRFAVFVAPDEIEYSTNEYQMIEEGVYVLPEDQAAEIYLKRFDNEKDNILELDIDFPSDRLSKAPTGTIADAVLRNIAFAKDEHHIEILLQTEAERLATRVRDAKTASMMEYEQAIRGRSGDDS